MTVKILKLVNSNRLNFRRRFRGNPKHRSALPVVPYEHRGAALRAIPVDSQTDVEIALNYFRAENDQWLRKIIALRLLGSDLESTIQLSDREELSEAVRCRVIP